jgi:hypothetical protein
VRKGPKALHIFFGSAMDPLEQFVRLGSEARQLMDDFLRDTCIAFLEFTCISLTLALKKTKNKTTKQSVWLTPFC